MRSLVYKLSITLALVAIAAGCGKDPTPQPSTTEPPMREDGGPGGRALAAPEPTPGVHFRLSDAEGGGAEGAEPVPTAQTEPLDAAEVEAILGRLPELPAGSAEQVDFAFQPGPAPPAIAGETREEAFPPEDERGDPPPAVEDGPVGVARYGPEGEMQTVPRLSVTFDQAMVPLTSHAALAAEAVPVQLEPQPEGQWRWVGSRTLLFEPEGGRFPMATEYRVMVPAGVEDAAGQALGEAVSWAFTTPPVDLVTVHPDGDASIQRQPVIFVGFDQAVDAAAILPFIELTVGRQIFELREAAPADIEADERVSGMVEDWSSDHRADRWIALRPAEALPLGAEVEIRFLDGLPSAEGPRVTEEEVTRGFQVYDALRITRIGCQRDGDLVELGENDRDARIRNCQPFAGWWLLLNNPLDLESVDPAAFTVEPEIPGMRVQAYSDQIRIEGASVGRSSYTLRPPAGIRDVFGQTLGEGYELRFDTGDMPAALSVPGDELMVLDPAAEGALTAYSINNDALSVALYQVTPEDWQAYQIARRTMRDEQPMDPPGVPAWQGEVEPEGDRNAVARARIDLAPALDERGHGQVLAVIEPARWRWDDDDWQNRPQWRWIQVSDLGLDVFSDAGALTARVTDLADGAPEADVELDLYRLPQIEWRGETTVAGAPSRIGSARTDADGLAEIEDPLAEVGPDSEAGFEAREAFGETMLVARSEGDLSMLPYGVLGWGGPGEQLAWYVLDDRGLYKPGEEASIKGWIRRLDLGEGGDVAALEDGPTEVAWTLRAPNGEEAGSGRFAVSPLGGFSGVVPIAEDSELGEAWLQLQAVGATDVTSGREQGHVLRIAEFRRPEFEVTATLDDPDLIFGDRAIVTAMAEYYAGGPLAGAEAQWQVSARPTQYSPPGHEGFVFGRWQPWWGGGDYDSFIEPMSEESAQSHLGFTDSMGQHRLAVDLEGAVPIGPASFQAQATVMDVNRQAWTGSASFLVHPARDYAGLRLDRWYTDPGQPIEVEAIVADIDGQLQSGRTVELVAERLEGRWLGDRWLEEPVPAGQCTLTSTEEPATCELRFETGGRHRLTAEIVDAEGRVNQTELTFWVSGGQPRLPRGEGLEEARVELIPDAEDYQPGDTARILVQAPFAPTEGLWSLRRSGLVERQPFRIDESGSVTLEIPIEEGWTPNVHLQVDLTGSAPRLGADGEPSEDLPARPAYASGQIQLSIPPLARTLTVDAAPREPALAPAGSTTVDVAVTDDQGTPLADAEVALIVVDEAVLALTAHDIGDPMAPFYPERGGDVRDERLRRWLQLVDPGLVAGQLQALGRGVTVPNAGGGEMAEEEMAMSMGMDNALGQTMDGAVMMRSAADAAEDMAYDSDEAAAEPAPIVERSDLNPLAAFVPEARTDEAGQVAIEVDLPDSVTRYRIWAVATDGGARFGKGESSLTARLPLIVRPSAPRFLNFGDRFELPVVVQNQTEGDLEVELVVRSENLRLLEAVEGSGEEDADLPGGSDAAGLRATIPAGDRRELRLPAAADLPGTAAFQAVAVSGDLADAQRVTLPVWTPATTEAFATYGEIDAGAIAQPVERPPEVVEGFGGLELTTSSTALSALTDAYLYLDTYPFEHEEATASRLLASVALVDVLEAFGAEGIPDRATVEARITADIERLAGRQNSDGGWGWWPSERRSSPFTSLHVAHALSRAAAKDYAASESTMERARGYLQEIDRHMQALDYGRETRLSLRSYALYVRSIGGEQDADEARALLAERDALGLDAQAWLLSTLAAGEGWADERSALRRGLANAAVEEAGTAQFTTGYEETEAAVLLASDRRTDAIALEALMADQPESDLIPKLVRGLLGHRVKGRWGSTQENAWVLLALDRYFRTYEAEEPDFVARAWLGEDYVGESSFEGRTPDRSLSEVPMSILPAEAPADLILSKEGPGRLYYRLGLRYAPEDLDLEPLERGFSVERSYAAVDDPDDVRQTADGGWEVRAGARVRVRLTMVAPARRYHVALVDPLPAGLEALNPDLATTGDLPEDPEDDSGGGTWPWWRWWRWYEHEAFRDARVEVFSSLLWDGVHDYSYIARATTPGDFVVPPAKAEELFHPETFGRSGSDRLRVVAP